MRHARKRRAPLLALLAAVLAAALFTSCDAVSMSEGYGNVNQYIFPYLRFTLSEDKTYYRAEVLAGARVRGVTVPGEYHTQWGAMPVREFTGFEDPRDAADLVEVVLGRNVERVPEGAFAYAAGLRTVRTSGGTGTWAYLPADMEREGSHFLGWRAGDSFVRGGDPVDPGHAEAEPVFALFVHHAMAEPTCVEDGSVEYYECPDCHRKYTDAAGAHEVTDVAIDKLGHLRPLTHVGEVDPTCETEGTADHYRCDRCLSTFSDKEALHETSETGIPTVDHRPDGDWHSNELSHWHECVWCRTELEAAKHDWDEGKVTKSATETTKGEKLFTCKTCLRERREDIPEDDHVAGETEYHGATCTEWGYRAETCAKCGETLTIIDKDAPPLGHDMTKFPRVAPTCVAGGNVGYFHCSRCGLDFANGSSAEPLAAADIALPAIPHDYSAAWSRDGAGHWHECVLCHEARKDWAAHAYDLRVATNGHLVSGSDCTTPYVYRLSCECGAHGEGTFEYGIAKGHDYSLYASDGDWHWRKCSLCGDEDGGSREAHDFRDGGGGTRKCSKCGYTVRAGGGGILVTVEDGRPLGHLERTDGGGSSPVFVFVCDSQGSPPEWLAWYLDGNLEREDDVSGADGYGACAFTFEAPRPRTYRVMCRYGNAHGAGSDTATVTGGGV